MEAGPSNGGDQEGNDASPPKKAKVDDLQQPSSSGLSATTSHPVSSSTSAESEINQPSTDGIDPPGGAPSAENEPFRRVLRSEEDYYNEGIRMENQIRSMGLAASAPANPEGSQGEAIQQQNQAQNEGARMDDEDAEANREVQRNVISPSYPIRLINRIARLHSQLASDLSTSPEENEEAIRNDGRRLRNRLINNIAFLMAPEQGFNYPEFENSSDDGSDSDNAPMRMANADEDHEDLDAFGFDVQSEGSTSGLTESLGSDSSSSNAGSSDESHLSLMHSDDEMDDGIRYFEYDNDGNELGQLDLDGLECLKTDSVRGDWNILREMAQRQHGLRFRKIPATAGGEKYNPSQFQKRAYGSVHLVQRLGLMHKLVHHTGCVNSLNFHPTGKLLASGSDDLRINLWNWESKKLLTSIRSGHKNNVFQTKFMRGDGYEGEVDIISTGRDGYVRHTVVSPDGHPVTKMLFRSHNPIHKVAVPARTENVFLAAGEDSLVRLFDLRTSKMQALVNVHRRLYSIATHPHDSEFCVSGNDLVVRVYDMRRVLKPLKSFSVQQRWEQVRLRGSVTCAVYNHDGAEILASFAEDDIYLFDNTAANNSQHPISRFRGHRNLQTIKGVNFFGPHSEYVVSGSDCGYIYIWEKRSRIIVNWLQSNPGGVVNCLEPHPEFPILATSGVDDDIKIWSPKGLNDDQTAPVFQRLDMRRHVRNNVINHNPFRNIIDLRSPAITRIFHTEPDTEPQMARVRVIRPNDAPGAANRNGDNARQDGMADAEEEEERIDNPLLDRCSQS